MHHLYHIGASKRRRSAGETRTHTTYSSRGQFHLAIFSARDAISASRLPRASREKSARENANTHNSPPRCLFQLQLSESVLRKIITQTSSKRAPISLWTAVLIATAESRLQIMFSHRLSKFHLCDFTSNVYLLIKGLQQTRFYGEK
jgi:hypothetical protein